jgi:hypothetical protein
MTEVTVAAQGEAKPMIKMSVAEYYEFLLKEQVREEAARRGIELVDEVERPRPRLVAEPCSATVLPLVRVEGERE